MEDTLREQKLQIPKYQIVKKRIIIKTPLFLIKRVV